MEPRRWLPYRHLQSRHLGLALATARLIAWIGILLVAAGIAYGITAAVSHGGSVPLALGMVIGLIGYGIAALALGGALAALAAGGRIVNDERAPQWWTRATVRATSCCSPATRSGAAKPSAAIGCSSTP